jgi:N-acyl-D-amino-acid deacylase
MEGGNMFDVLIKNGKIVTGTGNPWLYGDVAVVKDKIVKIGKLSKEAAEKVIDAKGRYVCPGFIDGHSHSDLGVISEPTAEQKIMQGVTTENIGMDGLSVAPIREEQIADWRKHLSGLTGKPDIDWTWRSFADFFDIIDAVPPSINITSYVGLGTMRLCVIGMSDREATAGEIEQMKEMTARAMEEGARGISAGLIYPPSQYQKLDEVIEIAKVAQQYDGIYDVHLRSESDHLVTAIEEVVEIGRQSEIPILITHFKASGKKNWGMSETILKMVENARDEGIDVTVAQYPYTAGSTILHACIPPWYHSEGPDKLIQMLSDKRDLIKKEIRERNDWENMALSNGWENIFVSSVESDANKIYEGKSILDIAKMRGVEDPTDAAMDLMIEEELAVGMVLFCMDESDVIRIMKHPVTAYITDGILGGSKPHPRVYGSFPRLLGRYVRDQGVVTLEEAVRKMTSATAERLRLKTKGKLVENYDADITVVNMDTVIDNATYDNPRQFPTGIDWVLVNGQVVVENGKHTGARPGKTIRTR